MNSDAINRNYEVNAEIEAAYSEWSTRLSRFLLGLCGSPEDAEDVLVETFVHAHRQWSSFKGPGSRRNWLYGIAANRARMSRRSRSARCASLDEEIPTQGPSLLDVLALREEVLKLSAGRRAAFLLVKGEGFTAREAAETLGRPLGTVLYEVSCAMTSLREALGENEVKIKPSQATCKVEP